MFICLEPSVTDRLPSRFPSSSPLIYKGEGKYLSKKADVEGYIARLSLSYMKRRPDALDTVSSSFSGNLGAQTRSFHTLVDVQAVLGLTV